MNDIPTYIYVIRAVRSDFSETMSAEEERIMSIHFEYLKERLHSGALVLAGPCLDGAFGIVVFRAASKEEAEAFMNNDPAVRGGLMTAELHPFRLSLLEGERTALK
jgi:uncharacterized protein YciI